MTDSGRTTTLLSAIACALLLVALLWAGAPRGEDEVDQLRRAVAQGEAALHLARLACELEPDPGRRADCHQALAVGALPLQVARGVLRAAETCPGEPCRLEQLRQARELLPEVRRVVDGLTPLPAGSGRLSDPEAPAPPPVPSGPPRPEGP